LVLIILILDIIGERNKFSEETLTMLGKMEEDNKPDLEAAVDNKVRRNYMKKNESLISEWVEVDESLYNSEFQYYEEDTVIDANISAATENNNICGSSEKFCLYCNFFKVFDSINN
jgi:hypothetical protein